MKKFFAVSAALMSLLHAPSYSLADAESRPLDGKYIILKNAVETNYDVSKKIMSKQENVTDKSVLMLRARQDGEYEPYRLYLGGRFHGTVIHERTNIDGKFPILSQLPPDHTDGDSDTYGVINDITVTATATLPYVTAFVQGEYTDIEYSGQEQKQIRKYYVTIGDLDKLPLYLTVGKKTVNFGNFDSYAPFTHTHNAHYFWAQTDEPLVEAGFANQDTMVAFSLIKNDRGLRVVNSPENDDNYENFAVNVSHNYQIDHYYNIKFGGGFLRGSIYDSALAHHPPAIGFSDRDWNGLVNANAEITIRNVDIMGEYTQTLEDWPATNYEVSAITAQARYNDDIAEMPVKYTLSYSRGQQGSRDDEWHKMEQGIAGFEIEPFPHVMLGAEYMINSGFVPLILPRITADDGVVSHSFITGAKIAF